MTVWCMSSVCWIPKATYTLSDFVILITMFSTNAPQCYIICTLPVLFSLLLSLSLSLFFVHSHLFLLVCVNSSACIYGKNFVQTWLLSDPFVVLHLGTFASKTLNLISALHLLASCAVKITATTLSDTI